MLHPRQDKSAAALVPVTVLTPQNAYFYSPRNLLISYVTGVVASTLAVGAGFFCIYKASSDVFSTSFSTILRTTRNPELDGLIPLTETHGAEPLSTKLAVTQLRLQRVGTPTSSPGSSIETEAYHERGSQGWTYFAVVGNDSEVEVASSLKITRTRVIAEDDDIDSLLMRNESF